MDNKKHKIGVVDDHFAIRDGYKSLLDSMEFISNVNTYKSVKEFYIFI